MRVCVASKNPVKCNAAKAAISECFKTHTSIEVTGESVPSGVADQPMSDSETKQGAENRASGARDKFPGYDLYVGMEGGLEQDGSGALRCFAWIVVVPADRAARASAARTACFVLPEEVSKLVRGGVELGEADDQVFGRKGSGKGDGTIGRLTDGVLSRTEYYRHAAVCALIPFMNPELYPALQ